MCCYCNKISLIIVNSNYIDKNIDMNMNIYSL